MKSKVLLTLFLSIVLILPGCGSWNTPLQLDPTTISSEDRVAIIVFSAPEPFIWGAHKGFVLIGSLAGVLAGAAIEKSQRRDLNKSTPLLKLESELSEHLLRDFSSVNPGFTIITKENIAQKDSVELDRLNESKPNINNWEWRYVDNPGSIPRDYSNLQTKYSLTHILEVNFEVLLISKSGSFQAEVHTLTRFIDLKTNKSIMRRYASIENEEERYSLDEYKKDDAKLAMSHWRNLLPHLSVETLTDFRGNERGTETLETDRNSL